jgi:hypothetical protein
MKTWRNLDNFNRDEEALYKGRVTILVHGSSLFSMIFEGGEEYG